MKILYILPRKDYFQHGSNGRVAHAIGVIKGLRQCGVHVTVLSGPEATRFCDCATRVHEITAIIPFMWYVKLFCAVLVERKVVDFTVMRYSFRLGWMAAIFLRVVLGKRWGFELNSFGYLSQQNLAQFKFLIKKLELPLFKISPFVNCVSDVLLEELPNRVRTRTITYNAADPLDPNYSKIHFKGGLSRIVKIVYFGMFYNYYLLKETAKVLSDIEKVQLHLYGYGQQLEILKKISSSSKNIFMHGKYSFNNLMSSGQLSGKSFLLLPYKSIPLPYHSPIKLYEYMSIGLPIISTRVGQQSVVLEKLQRECRNAVIFYEGEKHLRKIVLEIVQTEYKHDAKCVKRYFKKNHTWKMRMQKYLDTIETHLDEHSGWSSKKN